jgi:phospholipid/cholesterol/gamma-HCH transport system permease protein
MTTPASAPAPPRDPSSPSPRTPTPPLGFPIPLRGLEAAGGRFISRSRVGGGALYWLFWLLFSRRAVVSTGVALEIETLGLGAVRIVIGASILVGLIATFQVATQLSDYGAQVMSARAIGWFTARELGPLTAALIIVARSASAIAGELASMTANAEVDALRAMGLDPVKYLVTPKLAALLVVLPAMTVIATFCIGTGVLTGNILLGFNTNDILGDLRESIRVRDLLIGIGKAAIFALVISVIAADEGLSIQRRVHAIGSAATRSVMLCVIAVLAVDTVVNVFFYFIPGLV